MLTRVAYSHSAPALALSLIACLVLAAPVVGAQPKGQPALHSRADITDQHLQAFAKAFLKASRIFNVYDAKIRMAQNTDEVMALQREANAKMNEAVVEEGLTVQEYNKIYAAAQQDEQLRDKVNRLILEKESQVK